MDTLAAIYVLKFIHYLGIILLVGNITVTAVWKVFANRTGDARIVAFGQRLVTGTDFGLTIPGIVLTMIGGYGLIYVSGHSVTSTPWLVWSQILFLVAGLIWLGILVPIQVRQHRMSNRFDDSGAIPEEYRRLSGRWIMWGLISTVPLVAVLWLMIVKPYY